MRLHTNGRYVCGRNAEVDGDHFRFVGSGRSVGVVKILEPVSPMLNYFEIQIVDKGRDTAIGIGVGEYKYPLDRMPGWNSNAIGYHADDGRLFHQNGFGRAFGPLCTTGDRMGCGVDFTADVGETYVNVFFTKNGVQIGQPTKVKRPVYGLYPLIGLHSENEKIVYQGHTRMLPSLIMEPMETNKSPSNYWLRSNAVRFVEDSLTLEYAGEGLNKQDVGIAQSKDRLTPSNHYFELQILDSGKEGWIAIGLGKSTYPLTRHPGWNPGGVGYHADNGHIYKEKGQGDPFGPLCTVGDTMGCGIKFSKFGDHDYVSDSSDEEADSELQGDISYGLEEGDYDDYDDYDYDYDDYYDRDLFARLHRKLMPPVVRKSVQGTSCESRGKKDVKCVVYFTKNGELVGETECSVPKGGFYPVVAMLSPGEKIRVNFDPLSG